MTITLALAVVLVACGPSAVPSPNSAFADTTPLGDPPSDPTLSSESIPPFPTPGPTIEPSPPEPTLTAAPPPLSPEPGVSVPSATPDAVATVDPPPDPSDLISARVDGGP